MDWTPTRTEGLARLKTFLPNAGRHYAEERNYDYGPEARENVSCLSPWIRHRLLTEREVVDTVLARHSFKQAQAFIHEMVWRTYWKGWLESRPIIWTAYREAVEACLRDFDADPRIYARYCEAVEGRTGIAPFDAWVQELVSTGYLHNHARMWFASIWVFTLELPWPLGADFFYRHLLDGDPASNTLSWRWVAGLHIRGKTYLARADNIAEYTDGRYALKADALAGEAIPLEGPPHPPPMTLRAPDEVPDEPFALLLTEEDLDPFSVDRRLEKAKGVAGLVLIEERSPLEEGELATAFAYGAIADALSRCGRSIGMEPCMLEEPSSGALLGWAKSLGVDTIVVIDPPVGPVREALDDVAPALEGAGVALLRLRRDWDDAFWPHATESFFKLCDRIPQTFEALGIKT